MPRGVYPRKQQAPVAANDGTAAKTKNVTVDADLVEMLNTAADNLAVKLGFRPTLSQTLRYLIKNGAAK